MDLNPNETGFEQVSYLRARDPSIISYNRTQFNKVRCNLIPFMNDTHKVPVDAFVKIFLRLKGDAPVSSLYNVENNTFSCEVPSSHLKRQLKDGEVLHKNYAFSKIFESNAQQIEIFDTIVKPKMFDLINGLNSTFLAYGASGSGKTYTIVGTETEPGVIPRALEYLFRSLPILDDIPKIQAMEGGSIKHLSFHEQQYAKVLKDSLTDYFAKVSSVNMHKETYKKMQQRLSEQPTATVDYDKPNVSVAVWISFAEIYNESIFDLLQPHTKSRPKLTLRVRKNGDTYIKDLTTIFVSTGLEAYEILRYGLTNLNYAATALNDHSSRSHCIFTIQLVQSCDNSSKGCISTFNFCDLAGSERLKKTHNVGDRLKESNNINTSLLVLGRCLKEVRNSQKRKDNRTIPFRESKLTKLFQNAISGRENLSMIVNVNPSEYMYPETQHVLNFSAIAMEVKIQHKPKEVKSNSIEDLRAFDRITELEDLLEQMQEHLEKLEEKGHSDLLKYMDMFRQRTESSDQRCRERLDKQKSYYEKELQELNEKCRLLEASESNESVVEISDSDEEIDEERGDLHLKCHIEINSLKDTIKQMEREHKETVQLLNERIVVEKRNSTKHLERVIELECELEVNETYDRSIRLNPDDDDDSDNSEAENSVIEDSVVTESHNSLMENETTTCASFNSTVTMDVSKISQNSVQEMNSTFSK